MANLNKETLETLNNVIFSTVGLVAFFCLVAFIGVLVAHYRPECCRVCKVPPVYRVDRNDVVSLASTTDRRLGLSNSKPSSRVGAAGLKNYITLEEHLNILDSPEKNDSRKKEKSGHTIEFLPEENTVIQIEGTQSKITRITRTKIFIGEVMSRSEHFSIHIGELHQDKILVYVVPLNAVIFEEIKAYIKQKDATLPILTPHPRYIRYLGTCFNHEKFEAYVISDYIAGCTLLDMQKSSQLRGLLRLGEEEKVEGAVDIAEAVYFLHNLSTPVVHQHIAGRNILIDGETLRMRLRAAEIQSRVEDMVWCVNHGGIKDYLDRSNMLHIELAPEILLNNKAPSLKSDLWATGATILEILLEKKLWDVSSLKAGDEKLEDANTFDILRKSMERRVAPSILAELEKSTPRLKFLADCFQYSPIERPSSTFILRGMHQFLAEARRTYKADGIRASVLVPGRRIPVDDKVVKDPLVRQQVEWNVRQESGLKRRTVLIANKNYLGKEWSSLSANPLNDIRDVGNVLHRGGYGTDNSFENVSSSADLHSIIASYVDAVNKDPEDIDIIIFYYSGYGVQALPENIEKKRKYGIFTDREGIIYDLALVMCNESMFPVATLQTLLAQLNPRVKRKLLILDTRHQQKVGGSFVPTPPTPGSLYSRSISLSSERPPFYPPPSTGSRGGTRGAVYDWDVPKIPEETTEKLNSMFTIRTDISDPSVIPKAVDSHPKKMNGFLTGCFLQVLNSSVPNISDLPKFLENEMKAEGKRSKAHRGIECHAEFSNVGNIWNAPLLTH